MTPGKIHLALMSIWALVRPLLGMLQLSGAKKRQRGSHGRRRGGGKTRMACLTITRSRHCLILSRTQALQAC